MPNGGKGWWQTGGRRGWVESEVRLVRRQRIGKEKEGAYGNRALDFLKQARDSTQQTIFKCIR